MTNLSVMQDDTRYVKDEIGGTSNLIKVPFLFTDNVEVISSVVEQNKVTYDGSDNVFILGSAEYGVLGTNKLGDSASTTELYSVLPNNDTYIEYFTDTHFIDGVSDGVIDTDAQTYTLDALEVIQSTIITKLREPITSVTITDIGDFTTGINEMKLGTLQLGTTVFGGGSALMQVSNDGGTTWHNITAFGRYDFSTSSATDELKFKITANETVTLTKVVIKVN